MFIMGLERQVALLILESFLYDRHCLRATASGNPHASTLTRVVARAWHIKMMFFAFSSAVRASCVSIVTWPDNNRFLHRPQIPERHS